MRHLLVTMLKLIFNSTLQTIIKKHKKKEYKKAHKTVRNVFSKLFNKYYRMRNKFLSNICILIVEIN